jgi:hypothetical protein
MPMKKSDGLMIVNQAERGSLRNIGALLRSLVNGDLNSRMNIPAGAGVASITNTIYRTRADKVGGIYRTTTLLGLLGLSSSTTDLDIIGAGTNPAHYGQITNARNGKVFGGILTCLEAPATGVTDIDLYKATVATGKFDDLVTGITGQAALLTSGGVWAAGTSKVLTAMPNDGDYLYFTCGAAGVPGAYSAGRFLLELFGYEAGEANF